MKQELESGSVKREDKKGRVKTELNEEKAMNGDVRKEEMMEVDQIKCDNNIKKDIKWNCANSNAIDKDDLKSGQNAAPNTSGKNNTTSDDSSSLTTANKIENNAISLLKQEGINQGEKCHEKSSFTFLKE